MKHILAISTAVISATSAFAGSVTYVAPDMVSIETPVRIGGTSAWLIPVIIAAVILLAVTQNNPVQAE